MSTCEIISLSAGGPHDTEGGADMATIGNIITVTINGEEVTGKIVGGGPWWVMVELADGTVVRVG
jgi:hypothetical protein